MTAHTVFVRCALLIITNSGMTSTVAGTMTEPSTTAKNSLLPRNPYIENPYPASTDSTVAPTPPAIAYRKELPSQCPYSPPEYVNSEPMLLNRSKPPPNHSGLVLPSNSVCWLFVLATISHQNGSAK